MTGPTYPLVSNGEPFDVARTVLSQYANSPILSELIQNLAAYFDPTADLDAFYSNIWDIDTAQGAGLDIWGRIVGIDRVLEVQASTYFGFSEALPGSVGFNQAPFYNGSQTTQNYALTDDAYRTLILAKAAANICDGSIPAINQVLLSLFPGRGNCYVQEGNMAITYYFGFGLTDVEIAIVSSGLVLPKPAGVSFSVSVNPTYFLTRTGQTFVLQGGEILVVHP